MKTRHLVALATLVALLIPMQAAEGKRSPGPTLLLAPDEGVQSFHQGDRRVNALTGAPIALYRVGFSVDPADPETQARQYLSQHHAELGYPSAALDDLYLHAVRKSLAGTVVRLRQHVSEVPVLGAEVTVTINHDNVVTFVMNNYKPIVGELDMHARITDGQALEAASGFLQVEGSAAVHQNDLVVYVNQGQARLAQRVVLFPQVAPRGEWEVLQDAHSGEIFRVEDLAIYGTVNGDGDVFDPDPLSSAQAAYTDPGYSDNNDQDSPELVAEIFNRVLMEVTEDAGTFSLTGPYADLRDVESPFFGDFSQNSSSWNFTRTESGFEAAHTYYHLDTYMRYMNETLGIAVMPYQYSGGVRFDPHGLSGSDNSYYITSEGRVAFGEGGVDDAEDADVVIHELGHGIHDWVTNGGLSQVHGLSEGLGDYFAQSYSRAFGHWEESDAAYHWVFDWDGHNPFWGGRRTDYGAVFPGGLIGQIHTDGQIWATCNMRIWDAIGQQNADKAMLEGIAMTNGASGQDDAANAVYQAALDMGYSGSDLAAMSSIYQSCGYPVPDFDGFVFTDGFESGDTTSWSNTSP